MDWFQTYSMLVETHDIIAVMQRGSSCKAFKITQQCHQKAWQF
jgi:hypothetical protein